MQVNVSRYQQILAARTALGKPKACFYYYLEAFGSTPEQFQIATFYEGNFAFVTPIITQSGHVQTPITILGDFPEAVAFDLPFTVTE